DKRQGDRATLVMGASDGLTPNCAQVGGDLVRQHLLQPESEQMRRVAAIRSGRHVAAEAGRAARPAVAGGATIGQPGADGEVRFDITYRIPRERPLALTPQELSLEDLTAATNGAKRISRDNERRRVWRHPIATPGADLLAQ